MKQYKILLFALSTGLLFALSFPPMPFNILAFICFIPLLFSFEHSPKKPNLLFYLTFFVQHLLTLWWIGSWQPNADPFLLIAGSAFCIFYPFFYLIPMNLYKYIRRKSGFNAALLSFPLIMTAFEWAKSQTDLAFPWLSMGYSQVHSKYFAQIADLGGVWLITFVLCSINVLIYKLALNYGKLEPIKNKFPSFIKQRKNYTLAIGTVLLIALPLIYGAFRVSHYENPINFGNNNKVSIGIIQPNINPWSKWSRNTVLSILDHIKIEDSLKRHYPNLDLAVWTETSVTYNNLDMNSRPYNLDFLKQWIDTSNTSLITGFSEIYFFGKGEKIPATAERLRFDSSRIFQSYNSAIMINPAKYRDTVQIYRKMKLTPFSERLPFVEYLGFIKDLLKWDVGISNWGLGWSQHPLYLKTADKTVPVALIICIESIHPDFVRKHAENAGIYSIITNDAWYNHTFGPAQHYAIAQMRAIENKRFIVRSANGGISGFISPTGQSVKQAEQYTNQAIAMQVPEIHDITIYSRFGDWIAYLSLTVLFVLIIKAILKKKEG